MARIIFVRRLKKSMEETGTAAAGAIANDEWVSRRNLWDY